MTFGLRKSGAGLALGFLAACDGLPPLLAGASGSAQSLSLYNGAIIAAAPDDYCVDIGASRGRTGFAVMAGCDTIAGGDTRPDINGFVTVQAGAANTASVAGNEPLLVALLEAEAGKQLLSATGETAAISVDDVVQGNNIVTVLFQDTATSNIPGLGHREWRAFVDISGRMVTVAVRSLGDDNLSDRDGQRLLNQTIAALMSANQS